MPSLSAFSADMEATLERGFQQGMRDIYALAVRKSSGPFSSSALATMDHPYARRHGSPALDPSTINVQSGAFRASWKGAVTFVGLTVMRAEIVNDDPKADLLERGTRTMFARPIREEIEAQSEAIFTAAIEDAINGTLSQTYS